jgi:hypothetical protein
VLLCVPFIVVVLAFAFPGSILDSSVLPTETIDRSVKSVKSHLLHPPPPNTTKQMSTSTATFSEADIRAAQERVQREAEERKAMLAQQKRLALLLVATLVYGMLTMLRAGYEPVSLPRRRHPRHHQSLLDARWPLTTLATRSVRRSRARFAQRGMLVRLFDKENAHTVPKAFATDEEMEDFMMGGADDHQEVDESHLASAADEFTVVDESGDGNGEL